MTGDPGPASPRFARFGLIWRTALGLAGAASATAIEPDIPPYFRGEALRIGNEVQLLMDDYIVEDRWKLKREVGGATKHMGNPVVMRDQAWEGTHVGSSPTVVYDDRAGKFRMYFHNFQLTNYFNPKPGAPSYCVGYAESDDGFNWTKPRLKGFPYGEFPETNIVSMGPDGKRAGAAQVFLNPDQSDPNRRFMIVYTGGGTRLAYSADGLRWDTLPEPLIPYHSDFPNHLMYVPECKLWFLYLRPSVSPNGEGPLPEGLRHTRRRLALTTSPDLKSWSPPRTVFYPDERDEPDYDSVHVFRRHGLFIAMYAQMTQESGLSENQTYLASSRDGIHFERSWDRKPFLEKGPPGSFDAGQVKFGNSPPIERGEEMYMYYYASPKGQHAWYRLGAVGMATMRRDRFVGQWAGKDTGYLLTRQFVLEGSKLLINCTALPFPYVERGVDGIRVAIIETPDYASRGTMYEKAVPGFAFEDCDPFHTDNTAHEVKWKGSSDLSALKGKKVYLRFKMRNAGLYAFQIAR